MYKSLVFNEQFSVSDNRNANFSFKEMNNKAPAEELRTLRTERIK